MTAVVPSDARVRTVLVALLVVSAAIGLFYVVFQLRPVLRAAEASGTITIHHYYGLSAAVIFAGSQALAAFDLARDRRRYLAWLLPAAAYLFVIGLVGWLRFGIVVALLADTARAVVLVGLAIACERSRAGAGVPL